MAGAASPSSADIATPIPQPTLGVSSVAPPQESGARAEALMAAGREMGDLAQQVDAFGEHFQTINAQNAVNQLRKRKDDLTYDPTNGFMNIKGGDWMNKTAPDGTPYFKSYSDRLGAASADIAKGLSGSALTKYNLAAAGVAEDFRYDMAKHIHAETDAFHAGVFKDTITQATTDAVRASSDPAELARIADRAEGAARARAAMLGEPADAFGKAARSNMLRSGIEARAAANDAPGALQLFHAFGLQLDGRDALEVGRTIKTLEVGEAARSYVGGLVGGAVGAGVGGALGNNTGNITRSGFQYSGGKGAPQGAFETFTSPEHGVAAAYQTVQAKAQQNGGSISFSDLIGGNSKVQGWAPAANGSSDPLLKGNDPAAYAARLASSVGLKPGDAVPLGDDAKMATILREQNLHEKGRLTVAPEMFGRGIRLAKGDATVVPVASAAAPTSADGTDAAPAQGDNVPRADGSGTPVPPKAEGPPGFLDVRNRTIAAEKQHIEATQANQRDNSGNLPMLTTSQGLIDIHFAQQKAQIELAKNIVNTKVQDFMARGGPPSAAFPNGSPSVERPPPDLWNQLDFTQQDRIDRQRVLNAGGKDVVTDQPTKYKLTRMAGEKPLEFAQLDLEPYFSKLSREDKGHFMELQRKGLEADPTAGDLRTKQTIVKDAAQAAGLKWDGQRTDTEAAATNDFVNWVEEAARSWTQQNGRKPNGEEWQKITDGITRKMATGGSLSMGSGTSVFELRATDVPTALKTTYLDTFAKRGAAEPSDHDLVAMYAVGREGIVPAVQVPVLAAELKKRGRAVTPANLLGAYRLVNEDMWKRTGAARTAGDADLGGYGGAAPMADQNPVAPPPVVGSPLPQEQRLPVPGIGPRR